MMVGDERRYKGSFTNIKAKQFGSKVTEQKKSINQEIIEFLSMDDEEVRKKYKQDPFFRTKLELRVKKISAIMEEKKKKENNEQ